MAKARCTFLRTPNAAPRCIQKTSIIITIPTRRKVVIGRGAPHHSAAGRAPCAPAGAGRGGALEADENSRSVSRTPLSRRIVAGSANSRSVVSPAGVQMAASRIFSHVATSRVCSVRDRQCASCAGRVRSGRLLVVINVSRIVRVSQRNRAVAIVKSARGATSRARISLSRSIRLSSPVRGRPRVLSREFPRSLTCVRVGRARACARPPRAPGSSTLGR